MVVVGAGVVVGSGVVVGGDVVVGALVVGSGVVVGGDVVVGAAKKRNVSDFRQIQLSSGRIPREAGSSLSPSLLFSHCNFGKVATYGVACVAGARLHLVSFATNRTRVIQTGARE